MTQPHVVIVTGVDLLPDSTDASLNMLVYGDGSCRVYPKDDLDPRITMGMDKNPPYYEKPGDALVQLMEAALRDPNGNHIAQVNARNAQRAWSLRLDPNVYPLRG